MEIRLSKDEDILNKNVLFNSDIMVTYVRPKIIFNTIYMLPHSVVIGIHLPFQKSAYLYRYCQSISIEYFSLYSTDTSMVSKEKKEEVKSIVQDCKLNRFDVNGQPLNENCHYMQLYGAENDFDADIVQVLYLLDQAKDYVYIQKYHQ